MEYQELTEKIIGASYTVYNTIGFGFLESVYEKCLLVELENLGLRAESQRPIKVFYKNREIGDFVADIVVEGKVIVELKAVRQILPIHEVQLVNYLTATGIEVGLLINFGEQRVSVKRKTRQLRKSL